MQLNKLVIRRYRSINDLEIKFPKDKPLVICGANNVGKTNILRAIDLFFSLDPDRFNRKEDFPYNVEEGSRGGNCNIKFDAHFSDSAGATTKVMVIYRYDKGHNVILIDGKSGGTVLDETQCRELIGGHKFFLIEAGNVNLPQMIAQLVDYEVLPILDKMRAKQSRPLAKLREFIDESKVAVMDIEKNIGAHFTDFVKEIKGIDTSEWSIKILFPEYDKLREAISGLVNFTLYDKNKREIDSKGSGIQRALLLAIIKYISSRYVKKDVILGIDEPEAFLQPSLQKKVFQLMTKLAKDSCQIIITTHSPHFVDIEDVDNVALCEISYDKLKLVRRPNEDFYRAKTEFSTADGVDKVQAIKSHLGIHRNDSWEILKYNLIVEGEADKFYIMALAKVFGLATPNILCAGGVTKIKGYLLFLQEFSTDLSFKPQFLCLFDHDMEGRDAYNGLDPAKYHTLNLSKRFVARRDGGFDAKADFEIEDLICPDIIAKSLNIFLRKKDYNHLHTNVIKQRFSTAYSQLCMLAFISEQVRMQNSDKVSLPVESEGLKNIICENAIKILKRKNLDSYDRQYPSVKQFITEVCTEPKPYSMACFPLTS